jgi:hypothetical protein
MATPRIIIGNSDLPTTATVTDSVGVGVPHTKYTLTGLSAEQTSRWKVGYTVEFQASPTGSKQERVIQASSHDGTYAYVTVFNLDSGMVPIIVTNKTLVDMGTAGIFVSKPGIDVTDVSIAHTGNLLFDSTNYIDNSLFVTQAGSTVLAGYKHRRDPVFHAGNRTNVSIDFSMSKTPGTENIIPLVMLQFAVCNSSGHFHPNYADSANSQELAFMDSVWIKQLNVVGGTLNTEHQSTNFIDNYIQQGYNNSTEEVLNYGMQGRDEYLGSVLPHGTMHGQDGYYGDGNDLTVNSFSHSVRNSDGSLSGQTPSGTPKNRFGKHVWAALNSQKRPNLYTKSQWETIVRPDGWHINLNDFGGDGANQGTLSDFTPQSYAQMDAPFGSVDRRIDKTINKTQYMTPGRTGYWKQKTWGLIYYVDHQKLIIQGFNDKSTSNAMVSQNNANAHWNAWNTNKGDLGRIVASDYSGHGTGAGEYPNHGLNIQSASLAYNQHYTDGTLGSYWPTRHFKGHSGHGAFNHDIAFEEEINHSTAGSEGKWPAGAGSSIFDYYHDPNGIGSHQKSGHMYFPMYNKPGYLARGLSRFEDKKNGMYLMNEHPTDVRHWGLFNQIALRQHEATGRFNLSYDLADYPNRGDLIRSKTSTDVSLLGTGPAQYEYAGLTNSYRDEDYWLGRNQSNFIHEFARSGYEIYPYSSQERGGHIQGNFGNPRSGESYTMADTPMGFNSYNAEAGDYSIHMPVSNEFPYDKGDLTDWSFRDSWDSPARQEHMPRSYLGGWDNFLWDNVPLKNFFITQTWEDADGTHTRVSDGVQIDHGGAGKTYGQPNGGNYSQISPWMTFSGCINNMQLWPNGYPLWHRCSLEDPRHGYGSMWWFLKNTARHSSDGPSPSSNMSDKYGIPTSPTLDNGWDAPVGHHARNNDPYDFRYRPWIEIDSKRTGYLSYREAITPNTEVTTIHTNHFNPVTSNATYDTVKEQWDYFYVSYIIFNQGTGVTHDPLQKQQNSEVTETLEDGTVHSRPTWPLDPWTGQPLHD